MKAVYNAMYVGIVLFLIIEIWKKFKREPGVNAPILLCILLLVFMFPFTRKAV